MGIKITKSATTFVTGLSRGQLKLERYQMGYIACWPAWDLYTPLNDNLPEKRISLLYLFFRTKCDPSDGTLKLYMDNKLGVYLLAYIIHDGPHTRLLSL